MVPVGFQWVVEGDQLGEVQWAARIQGLREACPGAEVALDVGNVCVAVMQVKEQQMEQALQWTRQAGMSWKAGHAEHDRDQLLQEIKSEVVRRQIRPNDGTDMQELARNVARRMAGSITRQEMMYIPFRKCHYVTFSKRYNYKSPKYPKILPK